MNDTKWQNLSAVLDNDHFWNVVLWLISWSHGWIHQFWVMIRPVTVVSLVLSSRKKFAKNDFVSLIRILQSHIRIFRKIVTNSMLTSSCFWKIKIVLDNVYEKPCPQYQTISKDCSSSIRLRTGEWTKAFDFVFVLAHKQAVIEIERHNLHIQWCLSNVSEIIYLQQLPVFPARHDSIRAWEHNRSRHRQGLWYGQSILRLPSTDRGRRWRRPERETGLFSKSEQPAPAGLLTYKTFYCCPFKTKGVKTSVLSKKF